MSLPGGVTGVPFDIVSVSPFTRNNVPSVVTKDGTRSSSVTTPLMQPITPAAITPSRSAGNAGTPAWVAKYITNGAKAKTMPAERSISPPIISMISPHAMIAAGATNCDRFSRLAPVSRKSWLAFSNQAINSKATTRMLASGQRTNAASTR